MRWVVQTNLGNGRDVEAFAAACRARGCEVVELAWPPFCNEAPTLPNELPTVFYGSSSLIDAVVRAGRWRPGAWALDDDYEAWIATYGPRMLNAEGRAIRLVELASDELLAADERALFARPCRDSKAFAGQVRPAREWVAWARRVLALEDATLAADTRILVAEPVGLRDEWRLFVVGGRVVTGSHYRSYERLAVAPGVPEEVARFAEAVLDVGSPAPVVVMDVARCGEALFVVEFNGACSSGFYAADLSALVDAIVEHVELGRE